MEILRRYKSLFSLIIFLYLLTMVFVYYTLHYGSSAFERNMHDNLNIAGNRKGYANELQAGAMYIYKNVTKIVYVNNTIEKVVFRDKTLSPRYGPGENGAEVKLGARVYSKLNKTDLERKKKFFGFDTLVGDTVSLHRKLPDLRPPACLNKKYPKSMPPVSVVILFRDEWLSIVLRTAYSVLEMSPPNLLKEIVLVDDGSKNQELKAKIALHVANVDKFKLLVNEVPLGLMMARQKGVYNTTADYFIILDGHMEVTPGWLEPIIYRLMEQPNALLCSHIGAVDPNNFGYHIDDDKHSTFDLQFPFFDHLTLDQMWAGFSQDFLTKRNKSVEPIPYGTIQGMMTAMRKKYFFKLGGFDSGMKVWGSEQIELSVKVWLCGGRIEMIPCSQVLHMYRVTPWGVSKRSSDHGAANKVRMIEVWMDPPHRQYIYNYIRHSNYTVGDLTERYRIKKDNQCKPYQYFIDIVKQFSDVYFPEKPQRKGTVYNEKYKSCLDLGDVNNTVWIQVYPCHGNINQYFLLTEFAEIRTKGGHILQAEHALNSTKVNIFTSASSVNHPAVKWDHDESGRIVNKETNLCLEVIGGQQLALTNCSNDSSQTWQWG